MDDKTISEVMREMGRRGGLKGGKAGGKASLQKMSAEARIARAKKAAAASAKVRQKKKH